MADLIYDMRGRKKAEGDILTSLATALDVGPGGILENAAQTRRGHQNVVNDFVARLARTIRGEDQPTPISPQVGQNIEQAAPTKATGGGS